MFNKKLVLGMVVVLVAVIGLAVFTGAISLPGDLSLAGHACGSVCGI